MGSTRVKSESKGSISKKKWWRTTVLASSKELSLSRNTVGLKVFLWPRGVDLPKSFSLQYSHWREEMDSCLFKRYQREMKRKQYRPRFELDESILFDDNYHSTVTAINNYYTLISDRRPESLLFYLDWWEVLVALSLTY